MEKERRDPPVAGTEANRIRDQLAQRLFKDWTGVTNRELLAALWHNLCAEDRRHWLEVADKQLSKVRPAE